MPQPAFNLAGEGRSEKYRLRPTMFGTVLEELVPHSDGRKIWRKARWPIGINTSALTP